MGDKIPSFYLYLQRRLLDFSDENNEIRIDYIKDKHRQIKIPKVLIPVFLKELENFELIEKVNRDNFKIINGK